MMCCGWYFPSANFRSVVISLISQLFMITVAVSGQQCADTVGSLNYENLVVPTNGTLIIIGRTVPCEGTVVAWEFCFLVNSANGRELIIYPGIWMTNDEMVYTLVKSNNVTYISDTRGVLCPTVNLSTSDQFTAPAGSVVGLYTGIGGLLRTGPSDTESATTYIYSGNQNNVSLLNSDNNRQLNIAIRAHLLVSRSITPSTTLPVLPTTTLSSSSSTVTPGVSFNVTTGVSTDVITVLSTSMTTMSVVSTNMSTMSLVSTNMSTLSLVSTSMSAMSVVSTSMSLVSTSMSTLSLVSTSISTMSVESTNVTNNLSSDKSSSADAGIIVGCLVGSIALCIILVIFFVFLLWHRKRKKSGRLDVLKGSVALTVISNQSEDGHQASKLVMSQAMSVLNDYSFHNPGSYLVPATTDGRDYSRLACKDYFVLENTSDYISATQKYCTFSEAMSAAINSEYSEVCDRITNPTDEEEVYLDPGNSEADIIACFEQKKFQVIKFSDVSVSQKIGSGEFGTVHLGQWSNGSADPVQVAVKTLNSNCSGSEKVKFLREAAIMGQFEDNHIVRLHGVVMQVQNTMIVLEYMSQGDLREFLIDLKTNTSIEDLAEFKHDLLSYCRHVAAGMSHLSRKRFIHRDLAARNILVSHDNVCKIADFGMARDVADDNYYTISGGKIPVKWTAPEALFYKKYSVQSDVWSCGCVMYEIWSLGHKPYEDDSAQEYMEKISSGYRLPPPPGCPRSIYEVMIQCWHPVAEQRATSYDVERTLAKSDRILLPSSKNIEELSTKLGEDISSGHQLYHDLQITYSNSNS